MKTILKIACVILLLGNTAGAQPVALNTDLHAISSKLFDMRCKNFKKIFQPGKAGTEFSEYVYEETSYRELHRLEEILRAKEAAEPAGKRRIRVMRMIYGVEKLADRDVIRLIYLPDFVTEQTAGTDVFEFGIKEVKDGTGVYHLDDAQPVYMLDNTGVFKEMRYDAGPKQMVTDYRANYLKINRYGDPRGTFTRLVFDRTKADSDAEESTLTYKEINDFVEDEPKVFISNVVETNESNGFFNYRHAIAITDVKPGVMSKSYAANMGALCPIRCDIITVTPGPKIENVVESLR